MPYYNKFSVSINPDKIPLYNSVVYNNTLVCLAQIQLTLELYGRSIILCINPDTTLWLQYVSLRYNQISVFVSIYHLRNNLLQNSVICNNTFVCLAQIQLALELYGRSIILSLYQSRYNAMVFFSMYHSGTTRSLYLSVSIT